MHLRTRLVCSEIIYFSVVLLEFLLKNYALKIRENKGNRKIEISVFKTSSALSQSI